MRYSFGTVPFPKPSNALEAQCQDLFERAVELAVAAQVEVKRSR